MNYKSGNASLFASMARTDTASVVYVIHRDHQSGGWNVFKKDALGEDFVVYCETLSEAKSFCDSMNNQVGG